MNKTEFFILAMKAQMFRQVKWVISAFSKIVEGPEDWRKDPYPYRIVQTPTAYFFVDPENGNQLTLLEDADLSLPPFTPQEKIQLHASDAENLSESITSCYGNLLFNYQCIIYPFGNKIPYMRGRISSSHLEREVLKLYKDDSVPGEKKDPKAIYTDEYLKMCDAVFHLENYMQLFTPAGSEKSMTSHPDMFKQRDRLFEENKDRIHDPAVFAQITSELEKLDKEWLADDEDSMNFYLKSKSFKVVRRKLFETIGSDAGLSDGIEINPVQRSLSEGWDANVFVQLNNASRAASFSRGAETMLGGEQVKWLLRSSSNILITEDDCGSNLGIEHEIQDSHIGFTVIDDTSQVKLTNENIGSYLGKSLPMRSAMFCKLLKTDYCKTCCGPRLSLNPTAAFTAISKIGDIMLSISLAAAHSGAIEVQQMDTSNFLS